MLAHKKLSQELLRLFALGDLSATQVRTLASAAWEDGWGRGCKLSKRLATSGAGGHLGNCCRDVFMAARVSGVLASNVQPYQVHLPDGGILEMFLPHEIYPTLVGGDVSQWCLPAESLAAGEGLAGVLKEWADHPDVRFQGDLSRVGILGFHCDGVQYTSSMRAGGAKSMLVASLNVVSGQGDGRRQRRSPLFVVRKTRLCNCGCGGFHTTQLLFEVMAWSLRRMLDGVAPSRRHDESEFTQSDKAMRLPSGTALPRAAGRL